jgi:hypothetical protein
MTRFKEEVRLRWLKDPRPGFVFVNVWRLYGKRIKAGDYIHVPPDIAMNMIEAGLAAWADN